MSGSSVVRKSQHTFSYYYLYKPYGVLSQFSAEGENPGLSSIIAVPQDVYPVGRLDVDSEGLLLLTNDTQLNHKLLDPKWGHWRTYWVQVEGIITDEALLQLSQGVSIRIQKKNYRTMPARAKRLQEPVVVPERNPPIRFRKNIPTSWISLQLQEGKNRQVRRMTAAVGFPTLRLLRTGIEDLVLQEMHAGELRELAQEDIYALLKLPTSGRQAPGARGGRYFKTSR